MEQSIQSRTNGIAFRRPTFNRNMKRIWTRILRSLELHGRIQAAKSLSRHGYHEYAKNLLEGARK